MSRWTDEETAILCRVYPEYGGIGAKQALPHRAYGAITKRANLLGLASPINDAAPGAANVSNRWGLPYQETADAHRLWQACDVAMGGERRMAA